MTDWPDDWFRSGPAGAEPGQAGAAPPGAAQPVGSAGPIHGAGSAGSAEPTVQLPARGAAPYQQAAPSATPPAPAWSAQPPASTGGRPPRVRMRGLALTGWRRWLRPRPIL